MPGEKPYVRSNRCIMESMTMGFIIDAHEDLAYESLYGEFDYTRSVEENRRNYHGPETFGSTIGWPELQKARVGIIFGTIFLSPPNSGNNLLKNRETTYISRDDFHAAVLRQLDFYDRLQDGHPDQFRRILSRSDYDETVRKLDDGSRSEYPVGLIGLLEGAEGLRSFEDLELYHERGIFLLGPVWGGGRWCAGTKSREMKDALTDDGRMLLDRMSALGMVLDISHMKNHSAMDALDHYDGTVIASHANCNALVENMPVERHLNDETIRMLIEHDGVMGVIPFNFFLCPGWKYDDPESRKAVTLNTLANHIDHICQLAGNSRNAAIGSDFDGGFGYPSIPYEMNDISDLPKLAGILEKRGFRENDIENIFHKNWQRILERTIK